MEVELSKIDCIVLSATNTVHQMKLLLIPPLIKVVQSGHKTRRNECVAAASLDSEPWLGLDHPQLRRLQVASPYLIGGQHFKDLTHALLHASKFMSCLHS